ncbi:ABC transporter permease [Rhizobium sp. CFBP 13726]|uniref:ABC transporter permease n=1 Tax=Rhizobium sp. CFBP 13726 TaxID=2775296 RepID=UPI0017867F97|nr:ABC transporter permease [Rhizobium sp. CFBP 13726]MBD8652762.1 ABC transporter permease [Rhizobium sp. CFBP 13726]
MRFDLSRTIAVTLLAIMALFMIITPVMPFYDPYAQDLAGSLVPVGGSSLEGRFYLLGTDTLGRDILSRLALAGQVSALIGLGAVAVSLVIGVFLGLVAGYFRGPVEAVIMGLADLQLSIPRVLLLIAVSAIVGPSVTNLALLLGITSWVAYGRVARGMALSLREREFVLSARTQGATATWNIRKHLLPNVLPQMLIVGSYEFGQIVVMEASLSYLGLGVQPPLPSWGMMVSEGQTYLALAPSLSILPSIALFILVAGLQFLSQAFTSEGEVVGVAERSK